MYLTLAIGSMHFALCTLLPALGSMLLAMCASPVLGSSALGCVPWALCTWLDVPGSTHLALRTWLCALGLNVDP